MIENPILWSLLDSPLCLDGFPNHLMLYQLFVGNNILFQKLNEGQLQKFPTLFHAISTPENQTIFEFKNQEVSTSSDFRKSFFVNKLIRGLEFQHSKCTDIKSIKAGGLLSEYWCDQLNYLKHRYSSSKNKLFISVDEAVSESTSLITIFESCMFTLLSKFLDRYQSNLSDHIKCINISDVQLHILTISVPTSFCVPTRFSVLSAWTHSTDLIQTNQRTAVYRNKTDRDVKTGPISGMVIDDETERGKNTSPQDTSPTVLAPHTIVR